ncbi:MAG: amidohydrolase/deacetylase family metallohydrolase [Chloroflexi bacterium]|nr:amidohydrolase/deacetylase family metallohydrolase [Chloroflexota bacterium]MBT4073008.1 amidohydrolase/deacetylase family metallohydrolase [Chloroflexota bacterium]MBT4514692.1 amidohydrolase/deacetylase family metallohydrolase [Chloroflexota bacterium]MBT5318672.1 amidohydrolase/deacetylase family metallohydrolase [Chloroflexota bacterium]MBT6680519.1 amidohydrolase/deacetylase family metallohydrolase [Chloroflexota bacterium]
MTTSPPMKSDLLLKGGHVIDPVNGIDEPMDVAVSGIKIAAVAPEIPASMAACVADVSGCYVTPGLIDLHAHAWGSVAAMFPDEMCLPYGVTTMLDAGGSGWRNFAEFRQNRIVPAVTRVFALLNIVGAGMAGDDAEQDVSDMDAGATAEAILARRDIVVGIKTAHFRGPGWENVDRAIEAAERSGTFVMVDQNAVESRTTDQLLEKLRPGDIATHCFAWNKPIIGNDGLVKPHFQSARERGVQFDVGSGNNSFSFSMAKPSIEQGFLPDTISTDTRRKSLLSTFATMPEIMTKLLAVGMSLNDVVERSTITPALQLGHPELGSLSVGADADIAVLELATGDYGLTDGGRTGFRVMQADMRMVPQMTVRNGAVVWDLNGRSLEGWENTPPPDNRLP